MPKFTVFQYAYYSKEIEAETPEEAHEKFMSMDVDGVITVGGEPVKWDVAAMGETVEDENEETVLEMY